MRMRSLSALPALLTAAILAAPAPSGDPMNPRPVRLTVVASDSRGAPVDDLTVNDFQILDAEKPQSITLFRHWDNKPQPAVGLEPGEVSNRAAGVTHATIILFDLLNENFAARGGAQSYLLRGLKSLEAADGLYLYFLTLDGRLYPVHGMPGAGGVGAAPAAAVPWTQDSKTIEQAIRKMFGVGRAEINIDTRVRMTYRVLGEVARLLAAVPGQKNIVWITHGVPNMLGAQGSIGVSQPIDYTPLLQKLVATLDRIGVSIYPVQQAPAGMALDGSLGGTGSEETLRQFALLTGGSFKVSSEIAAAVRQAMNQGSNSYLLGYTPAAANWDGRFHKLHVATARKGVRLQFKTGYTALNDAGDNEADVLQDALRSSFDAAEIGVRGRLTPVSGNTMRLECRIDPADIQMSQTGARITAHLALQGEGIKPNGEIEQTSITPLDLSWTAEQRAAMASGGIKFVQTIPVNAGWTKVRLAVLDRGTHLLGSVTIPIDAQR